MRTLGNDKKGITPVVAIIILVAVAIAVSIAAAMWLIGLTGAYTKTEEVRFTTAYARDFDGDGTSEIRIIIKNTGTTSVTIDAVYVNDVPHSDLYPSEATLYTDTTMGTTLSLPQTLNPGSTLEIVIDWNFQSGVSYEIGVHTATGNLYTTVVTTP
ncbi:MAG: hypothetical protein DRN15_05825 [Thermoprotei archaeon]|mgnify:CR=1 FL=1|nr:MAG: hypothetical protein DRN15_05825 [Thermoprotei archaeon]RLF23600.1 MAG: hypothetical protein DRM97_04570 [Thermoprotei archaeon]